MSSLIGKLLVWSWFYNTKLKTALLQDMYTIYLIHLRFNECAIHVHVLQI